MRSISRRWEFHAVRAGHLDVEHGEIDGTRIQALQRALPIGISPNLEPLLLERHLYAGEDVPIVIDQGDRLFHGVVFRGYGHADVFRSAALRSGPQLWRIADAG